MRRQWSQAGGGGSAGSGWKLLTVQAGQDGVFDQKTSVFIVSGLLAVFLVSRDIMSQSRRGTLL